MHILLILYDGMVWIVLALKRLLGIPRESGRTAGRGLLMEVCAKVCAIEMNCSGETLKRGTVG